MANAKKVYKLKIIGMESVIKPRKNTGRDQV